MKTARCLELLSGPGWTLRRWNSDNRRYRATLGSLWVVGVSEEKDRIILRIEGDGSVVVRSHAVDPNGKVVKGSVVEESAPDSVTFPLSDFSDVRADGCLNPFETDESRRIVPKISALTIRDGNGESRAFLENLEVIRSVYREGERKLVARKQLSGKGSFADKLSSTLDRGDE